ncbi:4Fe-4S binding protein [Thiohalophilus sp.]|uniref:4Fe-4S binding protein n=1 Tax=Thiohalophilus sp. TaxID=3028392 RepID=UPI002ACE419F|nr:4Fe-4S binding protein [Thiohalophilus sp.]MDZ7802710.1 4Fe-4S binding protein [Thiohalophilus sp.]
MPLDKWRQSQGAAGEITTNQVRKGGRDQVNLQATFPGQQETRRPAVIWRRLHPRHGLRHAQAVCQALRSRAGECQACRSACPVEAIQPGSVTLELGDQCLGCGRCVPACPMGALALPVLPEQPVTGRDALEIDCRRVPSQRQGGQTNRIPCLGALAVADLLELFTRADGRPLRLLDRGWCAACPAGGAGAHPAQAALDTARQWLTQMGVPAARQPQLVSAPLNQSRALPATAEVLGEVVLSRRGFFREIARTAQDKSQPPPRQAPAAQVAAQASLARERQLAAIERVAGITGQVPPATAWPQLAARADRCGNHQGCVRICPTGALRAYRTAHASGVRFNAAACIACDRCVEHCPRQALHWTAENRAEEPGAIHTLTSHSRRECAGCGAEFSPLPDDTSGAYCQPCQRSRRLAADAFTQLFGARE